MRKDETLRLWDLANKRVRFERIAGKGADYEETVGAEGAVTFHLPAPFSFALYRYWIV
jgi:hypothetical protein